MRSLYTALVRNTVFANVMLLSIVLIGLFAATTIRRESNPTITLPIYSIDVVYPGANPEEVHEGVSQKIEAAVDGLRGVKSYTTTSSEGKSTVAVEVADGFELSEVKDRIRNAVDGITSFPERAEKPTITRATSDEQVALLFIWGRLSERPLKALAEEIRNELQALPGVSSIILQNTRPYEISVEVSEEKLHEYGLTITDISDAIRASSLNRSAGTLEIEGEDIRIQTVGKRYTGNEFKSIVIRAATDGEVVTLGRVAEIRDAFEDRNVYASYNGEPCVFLNIRKAQGEDSIHIGETIQAYIAKKQPTLPPGVNLNMGFDNTEFIRSQISMITRNGLLGLVLVLGVLWLFLEARLAFWVAMGIPISLAGAVVLLWLIGGSLNQITLVAMIVVMGIIVDDAIVVGESVYVHRRQGKDSVQAVVDGVREVALPVFASVSTTIFAFAPMMFIDGVMGQFVSQMPIVVICALLVSLLECLFLLPVHLNHRTRREAGITRSRLSANYVSDRVGGLLERFVERVYLPFVRVVVKRRYVTVSAAVALILVTAGLVGGGFIEVTMWPASEGDHIDAVIEFPPGTPFDTVRDAVDQTRDAFLRVADTTETKSGEPLLQNIFVSAPSAVPTSGSVWVHMLNTSARGVSTNEIIRRWREEVGVIPGAVVQSFSGESIGNDGSKDVEVWLQGADFATLRRASDGLKGLLAGYSGTYEIADNLRSGKKELQVTLKPSAHALGITLDDVSRHLYAGYYGEEAVRVQRGHEDVRVRVRYPDRERRSLGDLESVRIRTPEGHEVPLLAVADIGFREGVSTIAGMNGVTGVRVSASVDRNMGNATEINGALTDHVLDEFVAKYPGVGWSLSGGGQEDAEMLASLQRNTIIALLGIFVLLTTVFRSYAQPFIIMLVIPFGLVGAVFGHMLLGIPLSFLSMGGITALAGVLVNDSIVLIEKVNALLGRGVSLEDAVCGAGQRRFRAIFLTSISTCVGLGPIIAEQDLMAQVVAPMAVSIAGGVAVGTMLTLALIPAFLVIMNDARRLKHRIFNGSWPTREAVEPATRRETEETESLVTPGLLET